MKGRIADLRKTLDLLAVILLVIGLGSAVFIYRTAGNSEYSPSNTIGYEQGEYDGSSYPIRPEDSKSYQRSMELYGGKANLLADELRRWFLGLWEGKSLAYTIACITLFVSLTLFGAAHYVLPALEADDAGDNR